jgi:mannose-6-phosphate isomerase-like protein (cupin superfamily)
VIARGQGEMIVGDEREEVGSAAMILIPPGTDHAIRTSDEKLVYVSAASPPFEPADVGRWRLPASE